MSAEVSGKLGILLSLLGEEKKTVQAVLYSREGCTEPTV